MEDGCPTLTNPPTQMIFDLKKKIECLKLYTTQCSTFPKRTLVHRDGLPEGQYSPVGREEMLEIQAAFRWNTPLRPFSTPTTWDGADIPKPFMVMTEV